ncbi:hypothetical protein L1887_59446 [Cichorium endivia]|nr:hypothetical protein L1887_59446 [Cichorium endivia]
MADTASGRVEIDAVLARKALDLAVLFQILGRLVLHIVVQRKHHLVRVVDRRGADRAELRDDGAGVVMRHDGTGADGDVVARLDVRSWRLIHGVLLHDLFDEVVRAASRVDRSVRGEASTKQRRREPGGAEAQHVCSPHDDATLGDAERGDGEKRQCKRRALDGRKGEACLLFFRFESGPWDVGLKGVVGCKPNLGISPRPPAPAAFLLKREKKSGKMLVEKLQSASSAPVTRRIQSGVSDLCSRDPISPPRHPELLSKNAAQLPAPPSAANLAQTTRNTQTKALGS